jgi:hypothetical protein
MSFYTLPGLPSDLMTSNNASTRRLRVDPGQTGFYEGREFQTFKEFSLSGLATITLKAQSFVPVILQKFEVDVFTNSVRIEWYAGGTETNPFIDVLPIFRTNTIEQFAYQTQVQMRVNGTVTGGTLLDVLEIGTAQKGVTALSASELPLGFAPGIWYIQIKNLVNQTTRGVFKARWEERP